MAAASSSSSSSTPEFSSQLWKYHVFLSFRGEDTRKTFVDHLYTALEQKGIYTYKDDVTLPRGESIGSSLKKAIEESQIAVIVFSENYVDSTWCLDELEYIMRCKDTRGQIILPVFYHVDPSEMRKEKRKYGEAFAKHELQNKNKVESWRKSLVDASNVSGWEPKHVANGRHESQCIKEIVDTILHRLHRITTNVDESLVGVEARMQHLILKLQIGSGGKRMIGIWGVGGGGKTTLASSIYDEISNEFEGSCFVKNIREESSNKNGLENLQAEILSGVLKQKGVMVGRVEEGRGTMKDRLRHRKVLIVLDDVDNLDHLKELAGSRDWFGEGSRIIITTRDEHVLTAHKVDVIHNISLLSDDEAMKLFCKHAPRGHRRIEDYEHLSKSVVSYAGGLPLALRVLGCFLCDKEINEWKSALDRLQEIPDDKILEKLKISFDGLKPVEKELFLHIACFFRGDGKEEAMMILDACGYYPVIGVKVLIQKALITISDDGEFDMHDLVQEMGHHIVRGEHPTNPEKHSRVWKDEDVLKICAMDEMTNLDRIEAIRCDYLTLSKVSQPFLQVVANMKKLRCIDLMGYESRLLLPENFPPRELRCLTLDGLAANKLWEGYKGNAKDHYISLTISDVNIWKGLNWGKRFRMLLSDDWYDEYCGVLMFAKTKEEYPYINIIMKRGVDEDFRSELRRESEEEPYLWGKICVGYISFSSLRHTSFLNSTYDFVSFSLGREDVCPDGVEGKFRAVLVPRKSEDGSMQTPDVSEFWDYELDDNKAFRIQHVSNLSIKILWTPHGKLVNPFSQVFQLDEFIFSE